MRNPTKLVKPAVLEVNRTEYLLLLSIVISIKVKARERKCDISGYLLVKKKKWKKQWLEVTEFVLYVFERHEVTFSDILSCVLNFLTFARTFPLYRVSHCQDTVSYILFQLSWKEFTTSHYSTVMYFILI